MTRNSLRLSYQASFILPEASELNLEELPNDMLVEIPFAADLVRVDLDDFERLIRRQRGPQIRWVGTFKRIKMSELRQWNNARPKEVEE